MSCLFDSIGAFVNETGSLVRQKICDYLQLGGILVEDLATADVLEFEGPNYINQMRTGAMGGGIEIQSACNIWNLRIVVRNSRETPMTEIEFLPLVIDLDKTLFRTIMLGWNGGHYDPIIIPIYSKVCIDSHNN